MATPAPTAEAVSESTPVAESVVPSPAPLVGKENALGLSEANCADYLSNVYPDTDEIEYKQAVAALTGLGLIHAMGDVAFHPEDTMTRAEAAKHIVLIKTSGKDLSSDTASDLLKDTPNLF